MDNKNLTLGILNADELTPEVEQKFGNYSNMFQDLFKNNGFQFTFNTYQVTQENYPQDINDCDAYLITGSKASAYENIPWIVKLKEFVRECQQHNKKLIGICFGHQLIAEALGGRVEKSQKGWGVGLMKCTVEHNLSWMKSEQQHLSLLVSHQDQVVELPQQAERIAVNSFCLNSGFQLGNSVLAFQGHPEFSKDYLLFIMKNRREIIGEEKYQNAISSLTQQADNSVVAKWINNFISL